MPARCLLRRGPGSVEATDCVRRRSRIADRIGVDSPIGWRTYHTGLLANVYCHADAYEQARWLGDDIAGKPRSQRSDKHPMTGPLVAARLAENESATRRQFDALPGER
jgi:hypothetical protein